MLHLFEWHFDFHSDIYIEINLNWWFLNGSPPHSVADCVLQIGRAQVFFKFFIRFWVHLCAPLPLIQTTTVIMHSTAQTYVLSPQQDDHARVFARKIICPYWE